MCMWVIYGNPTHFQPNNFYKPIFTHHCATNQLQHRKRDCHRGASFKASSHQLGSAKRRTARSSFAYRHTSERISRHITVGVSALISHKSIYRTEQESRRFHIDNVQYPVFRLAKSTFDINFTIPLLKRGELNVKVFHPKTAV